MNISKLGIIIQREYLNKVKKKSFLLITFLAPVLFAAICVLPSLIMVNSKEEAKQIGVVDKSGLVTPYLENNEVTHYVILDADTNVDSLKTCLAKSDLDVLVSISELDPETKSVKATSYSLKPLGMDTVSMIKDRINDAVEDYRIEQSGVENLEEIMASVSFSVKMHNYTIDEESGKEQISESSIFMVLSMVLGMAIYMFIAMFSGMVMSSVIEEKSSRVVEVLVSSVKASELMFGKIIGVALVALTQFLLWILLTGALVGGAMGIMGKDKIMNMMSDDSTSEMMEQMARSESIHMEDFTSLEALSDSTAVAEAGEPSGMEVIWGTLSNIDLGQIALAFLFYFIFGYLLYASLFAAIGSAVENEGDSTQLQLPVTIPLMIGFFIAIYAFKAPDTPLVFWGSMIPFTSPIVMLARIPFGVATWELIVSIGLLIATFVACAWASAKVYKVGILMYGKKSGFKDLWKWIKMK